MKTAVIAFYEAFPPVCGAASVTCNLVKHLSGVRRLVQFGDNSQGTAIGPGVDIVNVRPQPTGRLDKLLGMPAALRRMAREVGRLTPDVVILEGASWVLYHYVLLRLLRARGVAARIVYHAHNVEYVLRREKNGPIVRLLTRWAERRLLRTADASFAVSPVDAAQFERLYGVHPELLPNAIDPAAYEQVSDADVARVKRLYGLNGRLVLFMGITDYKPNQEAIESLVTRIFPTVAGRRADARLVVIGGPVGVRKPWLLNPGRVPFGDVPAVVKAADVCVAPIVSGSGTRLKILEYWAAGKPVVSTAKGAEGLDLTPGVEIVIADRPADFAQAIADVLDDPRIGRELGIAGQRLAMGRYAWPKVAGVFQTRLGRFAGNGMTGVGARAGLEATTPVGAIP